MGARAATAIELPISGSANLAMPIAAMATRVPAVVSLPPEILHERAFFPDPAARPETRQPHHGGADVPVFRGRWRGDRLALYAHQHAGVVGCGDVLHRGDRRGGCRAH